MAMTAGQPDAPIVRKLAEQFFAARDRFDLGPGAQL